MGNMLYKAHILYKAYYYRVALKAFKRQVRLPNVDESQDDLIDAVQQYARDRNGGAVVGRPDHEVRAQDAGGRVRYCHGV